MFNLFLTLYYFLLPEDLDNRVLPKSEVAQSLQKVEISIKLNARCDKITNSMPLSPNILRVFRVIQGILALYYRASNRADCDMQDHITVEDKEKFDDIPEIIYIIDLALEMVTWIAIFFHLSLYYSFQSFINLFDK